MTDMMPAVGDGVTLLSRMEARFRLHKPAPDPEA